jgi:hypothetical protein
MTTVDEREPTAITMSTTANSMYSALPHRIAAFLPIPRTVEPEKQRPLGHGCVTRNNGVTVGSGVMRAVRSEPI